MPKPGDLLLVHMLHPEPVGSYFDRGSWPLHMTLARWFTSDVPIQTLRQELLQASRRIAPLEITVGPEVLFGLEYTIPVNLIVEQAHVAQLHQMLLAVLVQLGVSMADPTVWTGKGYQAHVTVQSEDKRTMPGDKILVDNFHMVRLADKRTCEIIAAFPLGASNG